MTSTVVPWRQLRNLFVLCTVVLAWLGGSVAQELHWVTNPHVRCAEHGEWIEAGASASDESGAKAKNEEHAPLKHEHGCVFGGALNNATPPTPVVLAKRVAEPKPLIVHAARPRPPPAARVLSYAPKTSPPRNV